MKLKSKKERREQIFAPQWSKNGRVLSLDAPQSLMPQSQSLIPINAFSVAEAMIALLIGTIILGFSAPMITKQLKHNDFTSIQTQILNKKIENVDEKSDANANKISGILDGKNVADYAAHIKSLETNINNLLNNQNIKNVMDGVESTDYDDDIDDLQAQIDTKVSTATLNSKISSLNTSLTNKITTEINKLKEDLKSKFVPSGAVMYFDLPACPSGWTPLANKYSSASGAFIRNLGESGRQLGSYQGSAVPDIDLALRIDYSGGSRTGNLTKYGNDDNNCGSVVPNGGADEPMFNMKDVDVYHRAGDLIKSNVYNKDVKEVRPNNVALLACRKN